MLLYRIIASCMVLFITLSRADLKIATSELPPCALECLIKSIKESTCLPTNLTCLCTNEQLIRQNTLCTIESCTIRQQLTTKNVTNTLCQVPIRDQSVAISGTAVAGGVLSLVAFGLRIAARTCAGGTPFGMDDWTMCLAMLLTIVFSALAIPLANAGLGRDMWTLPFDSITRCLKIFYFDEDLYLAIVSLIKISFLFFYLRVFPQPRVRKIIYVLMVCCLGYGIAFILVSVFQCKPIDGAWNRWDGTPAKCNNINAQGWTSAAFNMALDFAVLTLPLPLLAKLPMSNKTKAQAMLMFSLGFFVSLVSIVRLQTLIQFGSTNNFTWDFTRMGYMSSLEVHVGIFCACLPAIRSLFRKLFPGIFVGGTDAEQSSGGQSSITRHGSHDTMERGLHKPGLSSDSTLIRLEDLHVEREQPAEIGADF